MIQELYRPSFALLADLYQLTMAYGYWKSGIANRETVFHLFFRKTPFSGGYAITAGLGQAIELTGKRVITFPSLQECKEFARLELSKLPEKRKKLKASEQYPLGLERELHQEKQLLLQKIS